MAKLKIIQTERRLNLGVTGIKGDTGSSGVGIQSAQITPLNELLLNLTDGSTISAGFITVSGGASTVQEEFQFTGIEAQFVLAYSTSKAIVTVNGVQQKNNTDYTITDNILIFNYPLEEFDDIIVTYWV